MSNDTTAIQGKKVIITAGPTYEPIDPVRFIGNRSSGKQGYAIAEAFARAGANVVLVSGPTALNDPQNTNTIRVETAQQMLEATQNALPADIVICAAAVADFRPIDTQEHKIKKGKDKAPPTISLTENPDILKTISNSEQRPPLVVGFAAETQDLEKYASEKLARKGCDWIFANNVGGTGIMGGDNGHVKLVTKSGIQDWGPMQKTDIANEIVEKTISHFEL